jgi:CheY-like chemotaxis protein
MQEEESVQSMALPFT